MQPIWLARISIARRPLLFFKYIAQFNYDHKIRYLPQSYHKRTRTFRARFKWANLDIELFLKKYHDTPPEVVGCFVEVLSGAKNDRSELAKAIALAKTENDQLLVDKLDRLSRKVSFISNLIEDKHIHLKVATMPQADDFQLHIYAALAEQER